MVCRVQDVSTRQEADLNINTTLFTKALVEIILGNNEELERRVKEQTKKSNTSLQKGLLLTTKYENSKLKTIASIEKEKRIDVVR